MNLHDVENMFLLDGCGAPLEPTVAPGLFHHAGPTAEYYEGGLWSGVMKTLNPKHR